MPDAQMTIGKRVFSIRDGLGTVVDITYTDLRSKRHGVFSTEIKEVDVEFDSGMTKFVPPVMLTIHRDETEL
jgi:hypothetical protein